MNLFIKRSDGKEVQLCERAKTREELKEFHGETFTIGGSDYYYHVHEVYAKPSPDTTITALFLTFLLALLACRDALVSLAFSLVIAIISRINFELDKKAVKKFNKS